MPATIRQLLVRGEDFLLRRHLERMLEKLVDPATRDFNLDRVSAEDTPIGDLISLVTTLPMMAPSRVVVVAGIEAYLKDDLEHLRKALAGPDLPANVILITVKADKRIAFYRDFPKIGEIIEFKRPYADRIPALITQEAKTLGLTLEQDAAEGLVELIGTDLSLLVGELEKLATAIHPETRITRKCVEDTAAPGVAENIFGLGEKIGERDFGGASSLLDRFLEQGEPLIYIVALVVGHFRRLLLIAEALAEGLSGQRLANRTGVNPYFAGRYERQARKFSLPGLRSVYSDLMDVSERLRRGRLADRHYFEAFLARTCLRGNGRLDRAA